jgi:hypothetical protein
VCTFLAEHASDIASKSDEVRMAMHVDDVIEVAWTATFSECPELLAE